MVSDTNISFGYYDALHSDFFPIEPEEVLSRIEFIYSHRDTKTKNTKKLFNISEISKKIYCANLFQTLQRCLKYSW